MHSAVHNRLRMQDSMIQAFQVAIGKLYRPEKPVRDKHYRRFICTFPCVGCGKTRGTEAMHTGPHAFGRKSSDLNCLPGCPTCHRTGADALDKIGPERFQELRGILFLALIAKFNGLWSRKQERTQGWKAESRRWSKSSKIQTYLALLP